MQSRKVQASSVGQMTKHVTVGINGTTSTDFALDGNNDATFDISVPTGAIVTKIEHRGSFTVAGSGTSVMKVGSVSDASNDNIATAIDLESASSSTGCFGTADTSGDGLDKIRFTITGTSDAHSAGPVYVWVEYRFNPDGVWDQAKLADPS